MGSRVKTPFNLHSGLQAFRFSQPSEPVMKSPSNKTIGHLASFSITRYAGFNHTLTNTCCELKTNLINRAVYFARFSGVCAAFVSLTYAHG